MLRHRLVRQRAINASTSSEKNPSSEEAGGCNTGRPGMFRRLSSDSLDTLLDFSTEEGDRGVENANRRRHSVACGTMLVDIQKPRNIKSTLNSALRRVSSAVLSVSLSQPSLSTLSSLPECSAKDDVILPPVLRTFRRGVVTTSGQKKEENSKAPLAANRRYSTDYSPPSYQQATSDWKGTVGQHQFIDADELQTVNRKHLFSKSDNDIAEGDQVESCDIYNASVA